MLHRDVIVLHGLGLAPRGLKGPVHVLGDIDLAALPARTGYLGQFAHLCLHRRLEAGDREAHGGEELGDEALSVPHQGQQQVGLLDLLVAVSQGDVLGGLDGCQRLFRKSIHIHDDAPFWDDLRYVCSIGRSGGVFMNRS